MKYKLAFNDLISTSTEPVAKYVYENGEKTEKISGYSYRLLDIDAGEVIVITLPILKHIPPKSVVEIIDPVGTPYTNQNGQVQMSIKATDIEILE
jgi:hypothetical protein